MDVPEHRLQPVAASRVDRRLRGVDAHDLGGGDDRGEVGHAASDLQNAPRPRFRDRFQRNPPFVVPVGPKPARVVEPPGVEPVERLVLAPDEGCVVEPGHADTTALRLAAHSSGGTGLKHATKCPGSTSSSGGTCFADSSTA